MIRNFCRVCLSSVRCKYCIDYGKPKGESLYMKLNLCDICDEYNECEYCKKYGKEKGEEMFKKYIEYVKSF